MQIIEKHYNQSALPENQLMKYTLPDEACELSKETINTLCELVCQAYMKATSPFNPFNWAGLRVSISWNTSSKFGSLSRRISKWVYDNYKVSLPPEVLQQIGIISNKDKPTATTFTFDITDKFNWEQGDFGDFDSCFFSYNHFSRDFMQDSGNFRALRFFRSITNNPFVEKSFPKKFYTTEKNGKLEEFAVGAGRAWIWQPTLEKVINKETKMVGKSLLIFNAYGPNLEHMAIMLSSLLDLPYKEVIVTNQGNKTGQLYINGTAFLIGEQSLIEDIKSIDIEQPT